ncbi:hypothetical protein OIO90_000690 [Microbotryomycetes sp. JL221]|nr:hypothetical protein OIO90_000690 [Microbotryomycetes sp. JL221]
MYQDLVSTGKKWIRELCCIPSQEQRRDLRLRRMFKNTFGLDQMPGTYQHIVPLFVDTAAWMCANNLGLFSRTSEMPDEARAALTKLLSPLMEKSVMIQHPSAYGEGPLQQMRNKAFDLNMNFIEKAKAVIAVGAAVAQYGDHEEFTRIMQTRPHASLEQEPRWAHAFTTELDWSSWLDHFKAFNVAHAYASGNPAPTQSFLLSRRQRHIYRRNWQ